MQSSWPAAAGTRFWPLSRTARPKQLLDLTGGRTMIQATVDRLGDSCRPSGRWIITNRSLVEPIAEQLPQLAARADRRRAVQARHRPRHRPGGAARSRSDDPEATMVVMPADHLIQPTEAFQARFGRRRAVVEQQPETLVTFGIKPTYPAELWLHRTRRAVGKLAGRRPSHIASSASARSRRRAWPRNTWPAGKFYWNSGIFVWKARTILDALRQLRAGDARASGASSPRPLGTAGFRRGASTASSPPSAASRSTSP